jgi:hypothetical protein
MGRPGRDLLHHPPEIRPGIADSERQSPRVRQQLSKRDQLDTRAFTQYAYGEFLTWPRRPIL